MRRTGNRTVGSNPTLSANAIFAFLPICPIVCSDHTVNKQEMLSGPKRSPAPITRIQHNLLVGPERILLTWLCSRMPLWVTPTLLTVLGLVGALGSFTGFAASPFHSDWLWVAIGGYVVQWFGDSMDGSLARF